MITHPLIPKLDVLQGPAPSHVTSKMVLWKLQLAKLPNCTGCWIINELAPKTMTFREKSTSLLGDRTCDLEHYTIRSDYTATVGGHI